MHALLFLLALVFVAPAAAQIADADRAALLDEAFASLTAAPDETAAQKAESEIWSIWFIGPDEEATIRLAAASDAIRAGDTISARIILEKLIETHPGFAEAWNQLAFAKFLMGDPYGSLSDIDAVLRREPRHFGALAGRAQIEMRLGRRYAAEKTMGRLGAHHPWMARRSAIPADPPPPPPPI